MYTTIRRNAFGKISKILADCKFIRVYRYDDMGDESREVDADDVLEAGRDCGFERVSLTENGVLTLTIHRGYSFTAYPSLEVAAASMTPQAVEKYNLKSRLQFQ